MTDKTPTTKPMSRPRTPLRPHPGLRYGHLEPIRCSCGSEDGCKVPHDVWLIQGGKGPR